MSTFTDPVQPSLRIGALDLSGGGSVRLNLDAAAAILATRARHEARAQKDLARQLVTHGGFEYSEHIGLYQPTEPNRHGEPKATEYHGARCAHCAANDEARQRCGITR